MKDNNLFIEEFCEKCDISIADFGDILKESPSTSDSTLNKVAKLLKIDFLDLYK